MKWFGRSWGAIALRFEEHVATPVGTPCLACKTPIQPTDQGVIMPFAPLAAIQIDLSEGKGVSVFLHLGDAPDASRLLSAVAPPVWRLSPVQTRQVPAQINPAIPVGCQWLPLVLGSLLEGEGMTAKIQLYCNPATSEITGEYRTLHEAIDVSTPSPAGALLICDGVILASSAARGWLFEQAGIERIHNEFLAAGSLSEKNLELKGLIEACITALEGMGSQTGLDLTADGFELLKSLRKAIGKS